MKVSSALAVLVLSWQVHARAELENEKVYSPDKAFVVAWFDTDLGSPIGTTRSIILQQLPHGDTPFSIVTFPRYTKAVWSADSRRCLILDAPDNGNTNTWLFTAKDAGTQEPAVSINPMASLYEKFEAQWAGKLLWRPGIEEVRWKDNETLEFIALDNLGNYRITLKVNTLEKPTIDLLPPPKPED